MQAGGLKFRLCLDTSLGDEHLPRSHTCFFTLDLPLYTNERVLRDKLLYAARYCSAIDNDTQTSSRLQDDDDDAVDPLEALQHRDDDTDLESVLPFVQVMAPQHAVQVGDCSHCRCLSD